MGRPQRYHGMTEGQVLAMALLTRGGVEPYGVLDGVQRWEKKALTVARWFRDLAGVGVLEQIRGAVPPRFKCTAMWEEAADDATRRGITLGVCPVCGHSGFGLCAFKGGHWCRSCMTSDDLRTQACCVNGNGDSRGVAHTAAKCPRCGGRFDIQEATSRREREAGLVYLRALCAKCHLIVEAAGQPVTFKKDGTTEPRNAADDAWEDLRRAIARRRPKGPYLDPYPGGEHPSEPSLHAPRAVSGA